MPSKEIHEDFIETLRKVSPSYNSEKRAAEFKRGRGSVEDNGRYVGPKVATIDDLKISRSCQPWLCVLGGETCQA